MICFSDSKNKTNFQCLHLNSALFSGLRGGIFMCTLARLNKRLKHRLFHTLMQQEVHFFEEDKPGEEDIKDI